MSARCRSCAAPVLWVTTENGKAMPVDAAPSPDGNLVLDGGTARVVAPLLETADERARPHYTSHFATCPQAAAAHRTRS